MADRLDLRHGIEFETTVTSAPWHETTGRWRVTTDCGEVIGARFIVTCCGMLSAPMTELFPGQETFCGTLAHTGRWPKEGVDLAGKRVAVVGIDATGTQVIQTIEIIAGEVGHLTVFVRTPQYVLPMENPRYGPDEVSRPKGALPHLARTLPNTSTGFEYDFEVSWANLAPEERRTRLEAIWEDGSLKLWLASAEMSLDPEMSKQVSEFVREKMCERLVDPALCDLLIPQDCGFGTHRVPLQSGYLEVHRRPNVSAVNVRGNPIARVTPEGIELADGTVHALDVIILATGFDAGTGALTRIDIRGREGRLKEDWGRDIRTAMGLGVYGFPNLFTTATPLAPSAALCNMTTCLRSRPSGSPTASATCASRGSR